MRSVIHKVNRSSCFHCIAGSMRLLSFSSVSAVSAPLLMFCLVLSLRKHLLDPTIDYKVGSGISVRLSHTLIVCGRSFSVDGQVSHGVVRQLQFKKQWSMKLQCSDLQKSKAAYLIFSRHSLSRVQGVHFSGEIAEEIPYIRCSICMRSRKEAKMGNKEMVKEDN